MSTATNLKPPSAKKIIGQISHDVRFLRRHVKIIPHIVKAAQVTIKNFGERWKCSINKTPAAIAASSTFKNSFETFGFNSTPQDLINIAFSIFRYLKCKDF